MVRLDNMLILEDEASCRFYPENSEQYGTITIDVTSGEIIKYTKPKDGCLNTYVSHARSKLHELVTNNEKLPDEAFSIWY